MWYRIAPVLITAALFPLLALTGCGGGGEQPAAGEGVVALEVWAHSGREEERTLLETYVEEFNAQSDKARVRLTLLPDNSYNAQVQAAALAGDLPDVLEFDGPFLYNYVWQGHLTPLDDLISKELRDNVIPSIIAQGTYRDGLYSVGMFDSGLCLYARRSALEQAGARIPAHPKDAWTVQEFDALLEKLAETDEDGQVLDLKLNYRGEWYTYGFSPVLQSAGADLIRRPDYDTAAGVLNSQAAVDALTYFQQWVHERKRVDPNLDDRAFVGGRVALSWVGHWEYQRYSEAFGDDLVLLPLPDFGAGSKSGQGSWNWGITKSCAHPEAAMRFIAFLLEDEQVTRMTGANAAVPGTWSGIAASARYTEESPLQLFVTQLTKDYTVPRPRTPAYGVITGVFAKAFNQIINGVDVKESLATAARQIDDDIEDNDGYPSRDTP